MPSRTTANPFADPIPPSAAPAPPIPPPKQSPVHRHTPARPQPSSRTSNDIMAAVRDTVAVRSPDHPTRARPSRSQTAAQPPPTRPSNGQHRSMSSEVPRADKTRGHKNKKTGSTHADVIDRLDFSGVGPMFHHDGPFDACAPSRNRQRQKAPMYAWTGVNPEDEQAYREKEGFTAKNTTPARVPQSPYYDDYEAPKKKVDAMAEAWGIHEPEPFEDFSAGGGERADSAPGSRAGTYGRRERPRRDEEPRNGKPTRRPANAMPPPKPIFTGEEPVASEDVYPPSPNAGANLGRNKSLMQRIRKMRDAPNVPVGPDDAFAGGNGNVSPTSSSEGASPHASRPAHRTQNSFLGRFGKAGRDELSPDSYVHVDDPRAKDLPPPPEEQTPSPSAEGPGGYFDQNGPGSGGGGGIGRKNSLMRKMRGVVARK